MAAAGPVLSPLELTRRRRAWAGWVRLGRLERGGLVVLALTTAVAKRSSSCACESPDCPSWARRDDRALSTSMRIPNGNRTSPNPYRNSDAVLTSESGSGGERK